jgi:hypothetical protein
MVVTTCHGEKTAAQNVSGHASSSRAFAFTRNFSGMIRGNESISRTIWCFDLVCSNLVMTALLTSRRVH